MKRLRPGIKGLMKALPGPKVASFLLTPLDKGSTRHRDLYLTEHNTDKRQTFMSPAGSEPKIPATERPQTHALDRAATGTGFFCYDDIMVLKLQLLK